MAKKIKAAVDAVETKIEQIVEDVKTELNEPVDTITVRKSWLIVAAIVFAVVTIAAIL